MNKHLYKVLLFGTLAAFFLAGCNKSTQYDLPEVTTAQPVIEAATGTVWTGGNIPGDNYYVSAYGICWSTTNTIPTIADSKTSETLNRLAFTSTIADLTAGTICYIRAYASNTTGTSYGEVFTIQIPEKSSVNTQVTTLAGNSAPGFVDGDGTAASFNFPMGVWADQSGNIYVADSFNSAIRKITPAGEVGTVTGKGSIGYLDGSLADAQFYACSGIAGDNNGNLYVADRGNNMIRKISGNTVSTLAGVGTAGSDNATGTAASFNTPTSLALSPLGYLCVADNGNHLIRKVTTDGAVTTFAGNLLAEYVNRTGTDAAFNKPNAVAVDASGNIYVAEAANHAIRKIDPDGVVSTVIGSPENSSIVGSPTGLAVDASGNLYISDSAGRILKLGTNQVLTVIAGSNNSGYNDGAGTGALFNVPQGLATDAAGNVYVADYGNHRIRKITFINN